MQRRNTTPVKLMAVNEMQRRNTMAFLMAVKRVAFLIKQVISHQTAKLRTLLAFGNILNLF